MNQITTVIRADGEKRISKNFEIAASEKGARILSAGKNFEIAADRFAVIPPRTEYTAQLGAVIVTVEKALLPFRQITMIDDRRGEAYKIAEQAEFYLRENAPESELILSALGGLLTAFATAFADGAKYSPVTEIVRAEILDNLSNVTFSLEAAIKKLPLNYDYVRKLFKKEVGATPLEFMTAERMKLAKSLLQSRISNQYSDYTVSQIAEACGFPEPLYFSRVFKKYYGVSPTEYSKK